MQIDRYANPGDMPYHGWARQLEGLRGDPIGNSQGCEEAPFLFSHFNLKTIS
jgi:hypothetical protein